MSFFIEVFPKLENDEIRWNGYFYFGNDMRFKQEGTHPGDIAEKAVNKYGEMCNENYDFDFIHFRDNIFSLEMKYYKNGNFLELNEFKTNYIYTQEEDYFQVIDTEFETFIKHGENYNTEFKKFKKKVEEELFEKRKESLKDIDSDMITYEAEWFIKQAIEVTHNYSDDDGELIFELLNNLI